MIVIEELVFYDFMSYDTPLKNIRIPRYTVSPPPPLWHRWP